MKIQIINGPNLNLLGVREPGVYGRESFADFFSRLCARYPDVALHAYQSNTEGELVTKIQEVGFSFDGIILNAGGYTHTSVALHDALGAVPAPCVEVHISNIYAREEFRHKSIISSKCAGLISGLGLEGYALAVHWFRAGGGRRPAGQP